MTDTQDRARLDYTLSTWQNFKRSIGDGWTAFLDAFDARTERADHCKHSISDRGVLDRIEAAQFKDRKENRDWFGHFDRRVDELRGSVNHSKGSLARLAADAAGFYSEAAQQRQRMQAITDLLVSQQRAIERIEKQQQRIQWHLDPDAGHPILPPKPEPEPEPADDDEALYVD